MEKDKKYVRRSYLPHQYEKEEEFLSKMAGEGWHFVCLHYGFPVTKYEFDKGDPVDYVYQLDYVTKEEDTEDYHSLLADAGWEEIFSWNGVYDGQWYYFRRIRKGGTGDRLLTDIKSKYLMYEKLWKKYGIFFLLLFSLEINSFRMLLEDLSKADFPSISGIAQIFLFCLFGFFIFWYIYMIAGILIKKRQLRRLLDQQL
jgi:hypothetical protein